MAIKKPPVAEPEPAAEEEVPAEPIRYCVNCGKPAIYKTRNPGANVDYYCEVDGRNTYVDTDDFLERLDATG